ncbi:MAG: radical SAM protein, partial [Planctomycetaceae bacterium]
MPEPPSLHQRHSRQFEMNRFVYPVISRRSRGLSVGINLNPDKICNFDCVYCQVDRTVPATTRSVDLSVLLRELDELLADAASGAIFEHPSFRLTPPDRRRINDIAFAGDGEPTTHREFDRVIAEVAAAKARHHLTAVKLVLITNASMFHRPVVQRGLEILDQNQGEIWAKLEAGTAGYYHHIDRTSIPFPQILENITAAAQVRPLVIQALFMRVSGKAPPASELDEWIRRLEEIRAAGGRLSLIQV